VTGLAAARRVADAVLFEGYLLYPYRSTAAKNQLRWQFGMLSPEGAAAAGVGERSGLAASVLMRPGGTPRVHVRFLQLQWRSVESLVGSRYVPVERLRVGDTEWVPWHEAVEREVVRTGSGPVTAPGGTDVEPLSDPDGRPVGRLVRTRWPVRAELTVASSDVDGYRRLELGLRNTAGWDPAESSRDLAARRALAGAHLLLTGAAFASLVDPPPDAAAAAAGCVNEGWWPVLVGDAVLVAPMVLPDQPEIAPESPGDLFDATEIDEILTLRVMTLTQEEKAAARGTDPRAAAIIDRCDTLPEEALARLHGVRRDPDVPWWDPAADAAISPETDAVLVGGTPVRKGSRVLLRPGRRADAQDMFLAGQVAVVTAVVSDVDGATHVAVVLADDPAADLHDWYGRYWYFAPDELEPVP
jgi:hypothetical protein